jgi:hypothetical protein
MKLIDRIRVAFVDVFWFPVAFPLSMFAAYSTAQALRAHREGAVLRRRDHARRGLSALHHPAMRSAVAARWRTLRSSSSALAAYLDRRDYRDLLTTLEDLSR